jgi:hypothetical protein
MTGMKQLVLTIAALATSAAASPPADAQCRLCEKPTTAPGDDAPVSGDVELRIESSLNFDRLIIAGPGSGAATIRPDGSSGTEGSVMQLGPRAMVGTVEVHGEANRAVRVELPHRIELYSISGGRITLDDVRSDLPSSPHLDAAGNLGFRLGGRLLVTGDADGPFRGDLPITVEYP